MLKIFSEVEANQRHVIDVLRVAFEKEESNQRYDEIPHYKVPIILYIDFLIEFVTYLKGKNILKVF